MYTQVVVKDERAAGTDSPDNPDSPDNLESSVQDSISIRDKPSNPDNPDNPVSPEREYKVLGQRAVETGSHDLRCV